MAKIELKQPIVEEISASIKDAQSIVLVDYRGLTVEQDTRLRKELREAGITYKVYKNTMMNFAFKGLRSIDPVSGRAQRNCNFRHGCYGSGKDYLQICKGCKQTGS